VRAKPFISPFPDNAIRLADVQRQPLRTNILMMMLMMMMMMMIMMMMIMMMMIMLPWVDTATILG
jgi:hypothetical protein